MRTTWSVMACMLLAATMASAAQISSLYGDLNCFNLTGVTSCPDGSLWETQLGGVFFMDYRTPQEKAANSVADIWFGPGSITWQMPSYSDAGATSATLVMRFAGIAEIAPAGGYTVLFDGTSIGTIPMNTNPNAYQEVLTYTYNVPVNLLNGADKIAISTGKDGYIMAYAQLTVNTGASGVPEPATFGLLLAGAAALGAAKLRKLV